MYGRVDWLGEHLVKCSNANGQKITIDWEDGPSPVQITLQMLGACSLVDVVEALSKEILIRFGLKWKAIGRKVLHECLLR